MRKNILILSTVLLLVINLMSLQAQSIKDIDGNSYKTVTIGTQIWMSENLKTTKYNDGTAIPLVTDDAKWCALNTPGYCWFNNNAATYKATYGALYNWFAVDAASNGGKNLCPTGWHVPTDAELTTLTDYLGGNTVAGGKLKETGTTHWRSPNTGATNESGFTALPGGFRGVSGQYNFFVWDGSWWGSTKLSSSNSASLLIVYNSGYIYRFNDYINYGLSIRCLRDN